MCSKRNKKYNDLSGKHFGRLIVLPSFIFQKLHRKWLCKCECGKELHILATNLIRGNTNSCGCLADDIGWTKSGSQHPKWKGCGTISGRRWSSIEYGAKNRCKEMSITIDYAWSVYQQQNEKCALTGWYISFEDDTASLDRIDNSKGYIIGNVQWVHKHINIMKLNHSEEYFVKMCKDVTSLQESIFLRK